MISVHTRAVKSKDAWQYKKDWCLPWHNDARCRGQFNRPTECATMYDIAMFIREYAWSPILWKNLVRLKANFMGSALCVMDFDDGLTIDEAIERYKDYTHLIGTTKSHTDAHHKFRVIIPFESFIGDLATFEYNMKKIVDHQGCDKHCVDGARFYFPCTDILHVNNEGNSWPVIEYVAPPTVQITVRKMPPKTPTRKMRLLEQQGAYIEGSRNKIVFDTALSMAYAEFDEGEALGFISQHTNLEQRELETTISSAFKIQQQGALTSAGKTP